ncbi:hypothetical protein PENSPDRAFT_647560 [Peniophora sp. CONT]|nr:hypothetical protein PENSPDRAFT_647560 [Peniophora sp. CONT]
MSISTRAGIAWNGGSLEEPTDTLVLTGNSYFVDVRVLKTEKKLDWAFAGTKTSKPGPNPGETTSTWHHSIDSLHDAPVEDSGILWSDPTDPSRTLERGEMLNPASGQVEPYKEVWKDIDPPPGTRVAFVEKDDGSAMVGIIGARRLGVSLRGSAWRLEAGRVIFCVGDPEGMDVSIPVSEPVVPGYKLGPWIVRECWETPDPDVDAALVNTKPDHHHDHDHSHSGPCHCHGPEDDSDADE